MRKSFSRGQKRRRLFQNNPSSAFVTFAILTFFICLALFIWMIMPHFVDSVKELGAKLPSYLESLQEFANDIAANGGIFATAVEAILTYINDFIDRSYDLLTEYLPQLTEQLQSVASVVLDIVLGVIFAIYFLAAKERISSQAKKNSTCDRKRKALSFDPRYFYSC